MAKTKQKTAIKIKKVKLQNYKKEKYDKLYFNISQVFTVLLFSINNKWYLPFTENSIQRDIKLDDTR